MTEQMTARVDAFEQTVRSTIDLCASLDDEDWQRFTECPGWIVQDHLSHLIGVERRLLKEESPEPSPAGQFPYVHNELGRQNEVQVDQRRARPPAELLQELRGVLERRLAALRGGDIDPAAQTDTPFGRRMPYAEFMTFRAFDCWAHEQDIRRAVGRPGNLHAPAAACARTVLVNSLPFVVGKPAGGAPGQSVAFEVTGATGFTAFVAVGEDGRARHVDPDGSTATTRLRTDWEAFLRLGCGRCGPDDVDVEVTGDHGLGQRVLANLAITP